MGHLWGQHLPLLPSPPGSSLSNSALPFLLLPIPLTSLPEGLLIPPHSSLLTLPETKPSPPTAPPLLSLLLQPLQLDASLPPARGSSAETEPAAPTEAHVPLAGCPSCSPLPARDPSQRKSLAAQAGGGGHLSLPAAPSQPPWLATLFIILKEEFGRLAWRWEVTATRAGLALEGWAPNSLDPGSSPAGRGAGGSSEFLRL